MQALLLRLGNPYRGGRAWTLKHLKFLADIKFDNPAHRIVFTEYRLAVQTTEERLERLNTAIRQESQDWRWLPVVKSLMSLRGVDFLTAMTIVAEIGDLKRFDHPRKLMSFLGLVPSEYSSGASKLRGSITRTGNGRVRKLLIESAWSYRHTAKISRELEQRLDGPPQSVIEIAWKAQVRLCHRYRKLRYRGVHQNKTCTAVARELVGFIWSIAQISQPKGT